MFYTCILTPNLIKNKRIRDKIISSLNAEGKENKIFTYRIINGKKRPFARVYTDNSYVDFTLKVYASIFKDVSSYIKPKAEIPDVPASELKMISFH